MEITRPANTTITTGRKTYKVTAIFTYENGRTVVSYDTGKRQMRRDLKPSDILTEG